MYKSNNQSGNVLFLILIAVVLFAALSYAVTQSTRGGGDSSSEKGSLQAARLLNYIAQVKFAIQRMEIREGTSIGNIYLNSDIYKRNSGAAAPTSLGSPADPSLYLFHPDGGGVSEQTFEDLSVDCPGCPNGYIRPGHMLIVWINAQWIGSGSQDDAAITFFGVNEELCSAINSEQGITGIPSMTYNFTSRIVGTNFDGSPYGATPTTNGLTALTDGTTGIEGHYTWCAEDTIYNRYVVVDVFEGN